MQVFIAGSPFYTAERLDVRRLNKQIIECRQIMRAINAESDEWASHPCVNMYREHLEWLSYYLRTLEYYKEGQMSDSRFWSMQADRVRPSFHTAEYFVQMKRRLFTKNNAFYCQWATLGRSEVNWYYVDGEWLYYRNGKRVSSPQE